MDKENMFTKKRLGIFGVVAVVAIVLVCSITMYLAPDTRQLQRQLKLGQKYLEEQDYEQAVVAFENAIAIDPKNVEAYLGLAEAYIGLENNDMAKRVLEQGMEYVSDERILEILERIKDSGGSDEEDDLETENDPEGAQENLDEDEVIEKDAVTIMYQAYYDKLIELQDQYGQHEEVTKEVNDDPWIEENRYLKGLCFAKLIDFNADGQEEMILTYNTGEASAEDFLQDYIVEIWAYQGAAIQKVFSHKAMNMGEGTLGITLGLYEGNYYLHYYMQEYVDEASRSDLIDEWYGFDDGIFGLIRRYIESYVYSESGDVKIFKIGETEVTEKEWSEDKDRWTEGYVDDYCFQNGEFFLDNSVSELVSTFRILSEYIGIEWEDSTSGKRGKYLDSVWKTALIGYWENLHYESSFEYTTLIFYEDGVAEMHRHNEVDFGTFEIEADGNITLYLNEGYLYSNAEAIWMNETVNHRIQLTRGNNIFEMKCTYLSGDDELFLPDSLVLHNVTDENADYSSASESIANYKGKVANQN